MLNPKNNQRELCYLCRVNEIKEIENYDRVELAKINGWQCIVPKNQFQVNDLGIYFEIDSKVDISKKEFNFLEKRKGKIKTQKMCKTLSQGLLMHPSDFSWKQYDENSIISDTGIIYNINDESKFLTEVLGVTYAVEEDNKRKAKSDPNAKYKSMMSRYPKFAKTKIARWCMKHDWTKKILYVFLGNKKKDTGKGFPTQFPYVRRTDEERIENLVPILADKRVLIASEKLDGTSSTYILERKRKNKFEFYVLSRNVRQLTPTQDCYHDSNIYWEMALKYNIENHLKDYLNDNPELTYVCVQGESVGNVQGNPLKLKENEFYGFNFIRSDVGRISSLEGKKILESWGMKWVPIISTTWINPDTMEEMKALATGKSLVNPNVLREGLVYRDPNDGTFSFKNVSNEFLLQHKG
jgi:hypothetical protein